MLRPKAAPSATPNSRKRMTEAQKRTAKEKLAAERESVLEHAKDMFEMKQAEEYRAANRDLEGTLWRVYTRARGIKAKAAAHKAYEDYINSERED